MFNFRKANPINEIENNNLALPHVSLCKRYTLVIYKKQFQVCGVRGRKKKKVRKIKRPEPPKISLVNNKRRKTGHIIFPNGQRIMKLYIQFY